ncbi:hypothetical protein [Aureimonas frigidaquae]|uniref:Transmembrane anti-sigma factor n=1 Tax=Aureimonas frigidaquae TaxID=424757 RepID=A0A0P0Z170_9HYPH|nr:hypothetical protein [Aureimonas frigidaquae]BAT27405.1 hypothetical protein [Aureimonas frigidaquae]
MAELSVADFKALSAYVDGALSPAEAAHLAARIAGEPALALALARLSALKAATASCLPNDARPDLRMPAAQSSIFARRSARRPAVAVLAASIGAIIVGTLLVVTLQTAPLSGDLQDRAQAETSLTIVDRHDQWASETVAASENVDIQRWPTAIMAAAHLRLAHIDEQTNSHSVTTRQEGFIGRNGCRVSLFSVAQASPLEVGSIDADVSIVAWSGEGRQFALVTRSMDSKRFALLAKAVRDGQSPSELPAALIAAARDMPSTCS